MAIKYIFRFVDDSLSIYFTSSGLRFGVFSKSKATAPLIIGVDIDVPLNCLYVPVRHLQDVMLLPGARISGLI